MTKPIVQSVVFSVSAGELYDLYVNPVRHAAFTGGKVLISERPGSRFSAFDGMLAGTMLFSIQGRLIVQRWRSTGWKKRDPDSLLILSFVDHGKKGRIDLVHLNVPAHDHAGVTRGWKKYYWAPLKKFLRSGSRASKSKRSVIAAG